MTSSGVISVIVNNQNTEIDSPLSTKIEIKTESSDLLPLNYQSCSNITEETSNFARSAFNKVLAEYLQSKVLIPQKFEPKLTRFPVLINDPFTLNAFALIKTRFGDFRENSTTKIVKSPTPPKSLKTDFRPPQPVSSSFPELIPLKVQVCLDSEDAKTNHDENSGRPPQKVPCKTVQKTAQNRIKNIPGLIVQRVRNSIKAYLTYNPKFEKREKRLDYIHHIFGYLNKREKEQALVFLKGYHKDWKTWHTIQKYLQSNPKYGTLMLDSILGFFGEEGLDDFNNWLNAGKMAEKSKVAVIEMKIRIGRKFSKIIVNTDDDDNGEDYLGSLGDKILKKEEEIEKKEEDI